MAFKSLESLGAAQGPITAMITCQIHTESIGQIDRCHRQHRRSLPVPCDTTSTAKMLLGDGITPEFCQVQTYATVPVVQFRSQTSALYKLSFDTYYISLFSFIFCVPTGEVTRTFLGLDLGIHRNIPDRLHIIVGATNPI